MVKVFSYPPISRALRRLRRRFFVTPQAIEEVRAEEKKHLAKVKQLGIDVWLARGLGLGKTHPFFGVSLFQVFGGTTVHLCSCVRACVDKKASAYIISRESQTT